MENNNDKEENNKSENKYLSKYELNNSNSYSLYNAKKLISQNNNKLK